MWEALQLEFMRNAVLAGVLASIACGIVGSLVVVNRLVLLSGGIAHSAYGGVGLALFLGFSPTLGATLFALGAGIAMGTVTLRSKHRADTVIGVMWAVGMALGVVFVELSPGYNVDLMGYLFGSILAVPHTEIWFLATLDLAILLAAVFLYKELVAMSYDEEFAFVVGIPVTVLYLFLILLTALTVVLVIRVVGLILVIALLTIPPYIAEKITRSLGQMMVLSCLLGIFFTLVGLWFSYRFNLTSGATIILVSGTAFFLTQGLGMLSHSHTEVKGP